MMIRRDPSALSAMSSIFVRVSPGPVMPTWKPRSTAPVRPSMRARATCPNPLTPVNDPPT